MMPDTAADPTTKPGKPRFAFRSARNTPQLTKQEVEREGHIVRLAFEKLGSDRARAFLNTPHDALGGRPLHLATASQSGADAVEQAMMTLSGDRPA